MCSRSDVLQRYRVNAKVTYSSGSLEWASNATVCARLLLTPQHLITFIQYLLRYDRNTQVQKNRLTVSQVEWNGISGIAQSSFAKNSPSLGIFRPFLMIFIHVFTLDLISYRLNRRDKKYIECNRRFLMCCFQCVFDIYIYASPCRTWQDHAQLEQQSSNSTEWLMIPLYREFPMSRVRFRANGAQKAERHFENERNYGKFSPGRLIG